jgi:hypothetical protein
MLAYKVLKMAAKVPKINGSQGRKGQKIQYLRPLFIKNTLPTTTGT